MGRVRFGAPCSGLATSKQEHACSWGCSGGYLCWWVERLPGITEPRTIHAWARRHDDFPKPLGVLKSAMLWHWPDVEKWARKTGRL